MSNVFTLVRYRYTVSYLSYSLLAILFIMLFGGFDFLYRDVENIIAQLLWMSNVFLISMNIGMSFKNMFFNLPVSRKDYIASIYLGETISTLLVAFVILILKLISSFIYKDSTLINYSYIDIFFTCMIIGNLFKVIIVPASIKFESVNKRNFLLLMICLGLIIGGLEALTNVFINLLVGTIIINKIVLIFIGICISSILLFLSYRVSVSILSRKEVV